jgi:hypothetical protein
MARKTKKAPPALGPRTTEFRLRRMAARQGLTLRKIRRFDVHASDYGRFELHSGEHIVNDAGFSLASIEAYLMRGAERREGNGS